MKSRGILVWFVSAATLSGSPLTVAAQASAPAVPIACGVERWRVKILADESRHSVSWSPESTSIAALRQFPPPRMPLPAARRIEPYELKLYRVHAVVRQILTESDGDWHLVLADPDSSHETLVAEIPDSSCALGSGYEGDYAAARRALRSMPRNALVELDGIGFFDYLHGQRGMAPNGFELHPVLAIRLLDIEPEQGSAPLSPPTSDSGITRQPTDSATRVGTDVQVWLNTKSLVYHCSDSRWYGKTKNGEFLRESEAAARGAKPAYGHHCSS